MVKALKLKGAVPAKRRKNAVTLKAKPKILKQSARAKGRPAKSTDRLAAMEKSILSLRAILHGVRHRIAVLESYSSEPKAIEPEAIEPAGQSDGERISNIESQLSDLKDSFDTRIDRAIIEIAERIETHKLARRNGKQKGEPSSGALASAFAKFEETGLKGTWLHGSYGSNSR